MSYLLRLLVLAPIVFSNTAVEAADACRLVFLVTQVSHVGDALAEDVTVPGGFAGLAVDLFADGHILAALREVCSAHLSSAFPFVAPPLVDILQLPTR